MHCVTGCIIRALLVVNLPVYEECDGLRRAVLVVKLPVYEECDGLRRAVLVAVTYLVRRYKSRAARAPDPRVRRESLSLVAEQRG